MICDCPNDRASFVQDIITIIESNDIETYYDINFVQIYDRIDSLIFTVENVDIRNNFIRCVCKHYNVSITDSNIDGIGTLFDLFNYIIAMIRKRSSLPPNNA